jgi:hypothetical protein
LQLDITNLWKRLADLENNNYAKVLAFNQAVAIAIVAFLTRRVQRPSPQLLYASPMAYLQQTNSAAGIVLFQWLLHVGGPALMYQQAIRGARGGILPKLHAYAFHVVSHRPRTHRPQHQRAPPFMQPPPARQHRTIHKPQEARIMLITLISFYCIHPALVPFKLLMCGLSLLGTVFMAYDRVVEWVNARQSERNACLQSSESALQFTAHLQAMLHVDANFSAAALGLSPDADRGYDPRILNQVHRLVDFFEQHAGRDLTVASADNPFWHTGNAVPLAGGTARERRPWDFLFDVMSGRSAGKMAQAQSAAAYVQDHVANHLFHM